MDMCSIRYDKNLNNEELFAKAKSGDKQAKDLLFQNNIPFVKRLVRKWIRRGTSIDHDELMSIGLVALTKAYNNYDPQRNALFVGFVKIIINNEIRKYITYLNAQKFNRFVTSSLDATIDEEEDHTLYDIISSNDGDHYCESIISREDFKRLKSKIKNKISEHEYYVFVRYFEQGMNLSEIARERKVSREAVRQVYARLVNKIKEFEIAQ